jgi:hypothetical protein
MVSDRMSRTSHDEWPVGKPDLRSGRFRGKRIAVIAVNRSITRYRPLGRPELPGEFAKLARAEPAEIIAFIERYGLLGYQCAYSELELGAVAQLGQYDPTIDADPVLWINAHAGTVRLILELAAALDDEERLAQRLEPLTIRTDREMSIVSYPAAVRGELPRRQFNLPVNDDVLGTAKTIISNVLNLNLAHISRKFMPTENAEDRTRIASSLVPPNLLGSIYWLVADALAEARIRSCAHCAAPFVAPTLKTQYCPPLMGTQAVSSCMNRDKQRRFRVKHSSKAAPKTIDSDRPARRRFKPRRRWRS